MDKLITDSDTVETSNRVKQILRSIVIDDWQSKPYHEHQNPVERRYQTVKHKVNTVMNMTGAEAYAWLLCMLWVLYILNRVACGAIGGQIPLTRLTGQTQDISHLFQFVFWDKVYFATGAQLSYSGKPGFPSTSHERPGRFVGFAESVGDVMTFKILADDTLKIHYSSNVRPAASDPNRRVPFLPADGEDTHDPKPGVQFEFLKSPPRYSFDDNGIYVDGNEAQGSHFKTFHPDELMNRTYLTPADDKGQRFQSQDC